MDKISVIVPIYNAEKYLDRCVVSIVRQSYLNLEIILVDDGSSDKSQEICERWVRQDKRVKVIRQTNGGVSRARNQGLAHATGDYVVWVDSDDYLLEDMIAILYATLKNTGSDMSVCDYEAGRIDNYVDKHGSEIIPEIITSETAMMRSYTDAHMALQYIAPWGKLYKRSLFDDITYPDGKIFEDIYVTHQILFKCASITVVHQKLLYYYLHDNSIMHREFHVGKLDYLEALKNRLAFFEKEGLKGLADVAYDEYMHSLVWEYSRTRDLLHDKDAMNMVKDRFRHSYKRGRGSHRYPQKTAFFLAVFNYNPELIVLYWMVKTKFSRLLGGVKR